MKLTNEQIENNYQMFIDLIKDNIKRDGITDLIDWLNSKDTKFAPASTKYHLSCKGGLVQHSLHVYNRLHRLLETEYGENIPYSEETIVLVSLLHDISKVNFYTEQIRNVKEYRPDGSKTDSNGRFDWVEEKSYAVKDEQDRFIFGDHSTNSYYMLNTFIKLTYEEGLAILHHMGCMEVGSDGLKVKCASEAYKKSTLSLLLFEADMLATFVDEKE